MATNDDKIFVGDEIVGCTRFKEMYDLAEDAWNLYQECGIPAKFYSFEGEIDNRSYTPLSKIITRPCGGTPLNKTLELIRKEVNMVPGNKKLVIVTDGESSDGDITNIIKSIQDRDVSITIRLITDETRIINYWNSIDKNLEINLDIIDAYPDEVIEIKSINPKVNYTFYMHRCREYGVLDHRLDRVDEIKFSKIDIDFLNSLTGPILHKKKSIRIIN